MNTTPGAASELTYCPKCGRIRPNPHNCFDDPLTPPAPVTEGAQREAVALHGCLVYLIERGSPAEYWAGGSNNNWTSDACEARCYEHEAEAEFVHGGQLGEVRVCAHMFSHVFDEAGRCERCRKNRYELATPPPPDRVQTRNQESSIAQPERDIDYVGLGPNVPAPLQPERVEADSLFDYLHEQGGRPLDPAVVAAYEDAMLEQVEEPTIKQLLNVMIASAQTFTDADGTVIGYRIRTGSLHRLAGLLSLTIPSNLPSAPPTDASGGVTEAMVEAALPVLAISVACGVDRRPLVRAVLEAADRARKQGEEGVDESRLKEAYDDANAICNKSKVDSEIERRASRIRAFLRVWLKRQSEQHIGAVIPDAGK